jgi:hypothetical protein
MKQGFQPAVGRCLAPEGTAWLHVVPTPPLPTAHQTSVIASAAAATPGPLLRLLQPRGVIARYEAARRALAATPGPWQAHPMALPGMGVSRRDARTVHQTLHDHLDVPRPSSMCCCSLTKRPRDDCASAVTVLQRSGPA